MTLQRAIATPAGQPTRVEDMSPAEEAATLAEWAA